MAAHQPNIARSALIIVGMQNDFVPRAISCLSATDGIMW